LSLADPILALFVEDKNRWKICRFIKHSPKFFLRKGSRIRKSSKYLQNWKVAKIYACKIFAWINL